MNEYLIVYEQGEDGGWGAFSPDVEGVIAVGRSREEVESRMREAMGSHLDQLREQGLPTPRPHTSAGYVAA